MNRTTSRLVASLAAAALIVSACGDDDDDGGAVDTDTAPAETDAATGPAVTESTAAVETTEASDDAGTAVATTEAASETAATEGPAGTGSEGGGWTVDTEDCVDPDRVNAPIEGAISIGSSGPLSGGPAAGAFAPVIQGYQAYIDYANENELLPGHEITVSFGDDQYDPALTPGVINGALDDGAHLISGMIGTPNNLAVRDLLNEECVPHLEAASGDPAFGEVADYPWTMGSNLPYDVEWQAYAEHVAQEFPDGATAALYYVNNDAGLVSKEGFEEVAGELGIEIVDDQTVEAADTAPPTAQLNSIAGNAPDVIVAFPLGAQCPTFLNELANQKAANSGWEPRVYLTNTCASPLILGAAGDSANGLYTSGAFGAVDITNPSNQTIPGVAEYLSFIESAGLTNTVPTSAAGWTYAEVTVEILRQAAESPDGLTQASIINAARNFEFVPSLIRDGIVFKTNGEEDGYMVESVQIVQYDSETMFLNDVGELITSFESS
jgi:ABC-type branched-subunit amino acid transport system substrate-binding protein